MATLAGLSLCGDGWTELAFPVSEHYPEVGIPFFVSFVLCTKLGLLNIILAVFVDITLMCSSSDLDKQRTLFEKQKQQAVQRLGELCKKIDVDQNGTISYYEFANTFEKDHEMRSIMTMLDVDKKRLVEVWELLDEHRDGAISYDAFVTNLWRLQSEETKVTLMMNNAKQDKLAKIVDRLMVDNKELTHLVSVLKWDIGEMQRIRNEGKKEPQDIDEVNSRCTSPGMVCPSSQVVSRRSIDLSELKLSQK